MSNIDKYNEYTVWGLNKEDNIQIKINDDLQISGKWAKLAYLLFFGFKYCQQFVIFLLLFLF